jgi:ABC-2 type transport system ATP-binding protein
MLERPLGVFVDAVRLHELAPAQASLEEAFMGLTAGSVEFHAGVPGLPEGQQLVHSGEVA